MRKDAMKVGDELAYYFGSGPFSTDNTWNGRRAIENVVRVKLTNKNAMIEVPASRFSTRKVAKQGVEFELLEDIPDNLRIRGPQSRIDRNKGDVIRLPDARKLVMFWDEFEEAAGAIRYRIRREEIEEAEMAEAREQFVIEVAESLSIDPKHVEFDDNEWVTIDSDILARQLGLLELHDKAVGAE